MGNVPTKEERSRSSSLAIDSSSAARNGINTNFRGNRRNTTSGSDASRLKRQKCKERQLQSHMSNLIVRFDQSVDGGYLAPFGTYRCNLDFDTSIVRLLIISRKLAPFYTPLQDFDASWLDSELLCILKQQLLHALEDAYDLYELLDDPDTHKITKLTSYCWKKEQKQRIKQLQSEAIREQMREECRYQEAKNANTLAMLASDDLLLYLYQNAMECPICFLYYPPWLNQSRCCGQPICTECFVQIKRIDPHPAHKDTEADGSTDCAPETLVSEPAQCPYCALPNYGVSYNYSKTRLGLLSTSYPGEFRLTQDSVSIKQSVRSLNIRPRSPSIAADAHGVITTDHIRPDWEQQLISARNRLARRAAAASAIHASNMLIDSNNRSSPAQLARVQLLEKQMIEEAMRLSLADEENRRRRTEE